VSASGLSFCASKSNYRIYLLIFKIVFAETKEQNVKKIPKLLAAGSLKSFIS